MYIYIYIYTHTGVFRRGGAFGDAPPPFGSQKTFLTQFSAWHPNNKVHASLLFTP